MALSLSPLPPGFIVPCLPTPSVGCKSGPAWVHEIKHDGYRLIARRTDDRVRLYTRRGFNWADRYPRIVEALRFLRVRSITIDGEAVWCSRDGRSDFDKLRSGAHDSHVFLYGFDLIERTARTCGRRRSKSAKASSKSCSPAATGFASRSISTAMARPFSSTPASSGLKASSRSGGTCPTVPAGARRGSRSRTRRAQPCCGYRMGRGDRL
jgi:hypothetical protein